MNYIYSANTTLNLKEFYQSVNIYLNAISFNKLFLTANAARLTETSKDWITLF